MNKILKKRKSNKMKTKHPLQSFFFNKFQEQVSKAPGFKPLLSREDFNNIIQAQLKADSVTSNNPTESLLPPIEIVK